MGREGTWRTRTMAACLLALAIFAASVVSTYAGEAPEAEAPAVAEAAAEAAPKGTLTLGEVKGLTISGLIDKVARDLQVNFLLPPDLAAATVTIKWNRALPKADAINILRAVLDNEGYVLVETPYFLIVKRKGAEAYALPDEVVFVRGEGELGRTEKPITAIMVLDYIDAQEVFNILSQLKDRAAYIAKLDRINAVIIKDAESRVSYLKDLVDKLDKPGTAGMVTVVPIEFADAQALAQIIQQIIEHQASGGAGQYEQGPGGVPVMSGAPGEKIGVKIIHDKRLNSIIIVASQRQTEMVVKLIKKLDILPEETQFRIRVFQCKNQDAKALAEVLGLLVEKRPSAEAGRAGGEGARGEQKMEASFIADEKTNKMLVLVPPADWKDYEQVLLELDQPQDQVLVEVWIVEVSSDDQFSLGIEWQTREPAASARIGPSRQEIFGGTSLGVGLGDAFAGEGLARGINLAVRSMTNTRVTIGGKTYLIPNVDAYLKALSEVSQVNVLSSPKLLTLNKEKATVDVKDKIPYQTSTISGVGADREAIDQWDEKEVGVGLTFTPQINADGFVIMELVLDVSSVVGADVTEAGPRPVIAERKTENKVRVENGQTIIISGLRRHDRTKTVARVPILGRIPLLGLLFRSTGVIDKQTNLMIFITPHIVTDTPAMTAVSEQIQSQDIEVERDRFEIEPKRWRRLQRRDQREKNKDGNVWQR